MSVIPVSFDALAVGRSSTSPFVEIFQTRDPGTTDTNYSIQQRWYNTSTNSEWILVSFSVVNETKTANWEPISSSVAVETLTGNSGVATPSSNNINVPGTNGISTTGSGSTLTITSTNGQILTGIVPDAHTAPGTTPVVPNSSGNITVTGGQVAAGTTTNVIQTNSLAANTYTIQIQRSQAVGSSTVGDNGVCHFSSANFSVDANGFVNLTGTGNIVWNIVSTNQSMAKNNGYIVISPGGAITMALPSTASSTLGDLLEITLDGATSWQITQAAGQQIRFSGSQTTVGTGGSITTTAAGDSIRLVYQSGGKWNVLSAIGNLTVV